MISRLSNDPVPLTADPYLNEFLPELARRRKLAEEKERFLLPPGASLADFASGHGCMGLIYLDDADEWFFCEYAPHAESVTLVGDFSNWELRPEFALKRDRHGAWEGKFPGNVFRHGMFYQLHVTWHGGEGRRVPSYARYVVQDENTKLFCAQVWKPEKPYVFKNPIPPKPQAPLIYESHAGMAQEEAKVGTFREYTDKILPRIAQAGYNTVQLMAVMEHPYYGSFGYHVANFFAVSSRFGTPDEFKELVDAAHGLGLRVIIDLVHSHAVKNEAEGLARIDGSRNTYFHDGARGEHSGWDSLCFNYDDPAVLHFLLSNCRFWLEEYRIDGFRFDGVTSMMYHHHGLNMDFTGYHQYFDGSVDVESLTYLTLANKLIHEVRPDAVTIAEDVSGMPGLAAPVEEGGIGFDYRMAMGVTDFWFKLFDIPDENWNMFQLLHELTNRRKDERSISYVECHDQAIVGGQTAIFRLAEAAMYDSMHKGSQNMAIDRAIALHKMARLATGAAAGNGYLNFMGNEFGHPEWIDFPREGNNWSCEHARRQWSLADDPALRFEGLKEFDRAMMHIFNSPDFYQARVQHLRVDDVAKIIAFERNDYYFIFNFHPCNSVSDYPIEVRPYAFETVLDSDAAEFGGFAARTPGQKYFALQQSSGTFLKLYLPSRTALVLKRLSAE